ncbi:hypothetical protein [Lutibacter sp.]|uniref:hypothetical protein n=1 Tax=Lutibacter sp. TaxID=1925666 RepID=UPI0034A007C4
MAEENKRRGPDYKGDGAAAWINKDKNGNDYISVKILGTLVVNLFPTPKEEPSELTKLNEAYKSGLITKEKYAEEVTKLIP